MRHAVMGLALALASLAGGAAAQTPAKQIFGGLSAPTGGPDGSFGSYAKGCMAGAVALPETGPDWQTMRLSRNRNWGRPEMIDFLRDLGAAARGAGWEGIYVGDIAQPRGGPMLSGHRSHQIGLDADIWMLPKTGRDLTRAERENLSSINVVRGDRLGVNGAWTGAHYEVIRAAASDPRTARIFVAAAIKRELCAAAPPGDRGWLRKIRPWWGHDHHFHVRLSCLPGDASCENQAPPPPGDGCDATLDWWFSDEALNPPPPKPGAPAPKPRRDLRLADLHPTCAEVAAE